MITQAYCKTLPLDKWYEICYTLVGKGGEGYAQDNQGGYQPAKG